MSAKLSGEEEVRLLKRQAKTLKKRMNITHVSALNITALRNGYRNWGALLIDKLK
jgi:cystathionine beta-lyase/cystathionine gamma-synthase